jgi:hypothetical protein
MFTLTNNSGINVKNLTAKYLIDITLYREKTQSKSFAAMSGAVGKGHSNWASPQVNRTLLNWFLKCYVPVTLRQMFTSKSENHPLSAAGN